MTWIDTAENKAWVAAAQAEVAAVNAWREIPTADYFTDREEALYAEYQAASRRRDAAWTALEAVKHPSALKVGCPVCEVSPSEMCVDWHGHPPMAYPVERTYVHVEREDALNDMIAEGRP